MPRVKLFAMFRESAGKSELEIEAKNLREVLEKLCNEFPKLRALFFEEGKLRETVHIMVNGRHFRGNLEIEVKESDVIAIFPPVSGG
ncbi:MAG: ubiquitin-like small modifier protein 1 [Archaeoglobaceae archaeon]